MALILHRERLVVRPLLLNKFINAWLSWLRRSIPLIDLSPHADHAI